MRIVTDGEKFAIVRRRWIFTQFFCFNDKTWNNKLFNFHIKYPSIFWMDSFSFAKAKMQAINNKQKRHKYWDVDEKSIDLNLP